METKVDQLARSAPFDLRHPHLAQVGRAVTQGIPTGYLGEVRKVFLSAAGFLSFLSLVAIGAAVVFVLGAIRHWYAAL